jgi:hypothetical protein
VSLWRRLLLVLSHLVVFMLGFGLVATYSAQALAERPFVSSSKRLGIQLLALREQPTKNAAEDCLRAVDAAGPELGERTARIVKLRVLAMRARASKQPSDEAAAAGACRELGWPRCDAESIRSMGAAP